MSIDDSVLRDTRVKRLAKAMGWSRRETIGALLDVWAVCYDRVSAVLHEDDVNEAAEADAFCAQLVAAGLAKVHEADSKQVRISGVNDRIGYLSTKSAAGRKGGVKSGESRRSKSEARASSASKQTFAEPEAPANPSPSASPSALADPSPSVVPTERRAHEPADLNARRQTGEAIWREHQDARQLLASELSVSAPVLHPMDKGRKELQDRLVDGETCGESLEGTAARCRHVLAVVVAECRESKSLKWLDGMLWRSDRFDRAASRPLEKPRPQLPIEVVDETDYSHLFSGRPLWERGQE